MARPCTCGHSLEDHDALGCNALGEISNGEDVFCPCPHYEEAEPERTAEDEGSDR